MTAIEEIDVFIRAKYPILYVVSWEERRVEEALQALAKKRKRKLHVWSLTKGMEPPINRTSGPVKPTTLPAELEALALIKEAPEFTIFALRDFHVYMKDHRVVRLLRDLAHRLRGREQTIVLIGPTLNLPVELEKDVTVVEFPLPTAEQIKGKIAEVAEHVDGKQGLDTKLAEDDLETLVHSAQGLTMDEIESALARSLVEDKSFSLDTMIEEKKQIVRKTGMLEYYPQSATLADIGGLDLLKSWIEKRRKSFSDAAQEFGIPYPRGMLLIGVQGCGKSLVAKAVAATFNMPMLKMDVGRIFGSLVGQSEQNMRRAIAIAESLAPCVLWIDELEKGFAGMSGKGISDSGTTMRVFSTFLTWMQEKTTPVFLVATANDVSALPPELLRKGRFDEIFFVDLPTHEDRRRIFEIHLKKRGREAFKSLKTEQLAKRSDGFSGAEIEQVVVGALNAAFYADEKLAYKHLRQELQDQVPLSRTMAESIYALREWARIRARPADDREGM